MNFMKKLLDTYDSQIKRSVEITVGLITWIVITSPFWASFIIPDVMSVFIIVMCVYWFWKSLVYSFASVVGYFQIKKDEKVDWLTLARSQPDVSKVRHIIILPNYKEHEEKLALTIEYIAKQSFSPQQIAVVLAMEEREGKIGQEKAVNLLRRFKDHFGAMFATYHPQIPNEVAGKSSNQAWAGKEAYKILIG